MSQKNITTIIEDFLRKLTIEFDSIEVLQTQTHSTFLIHTKDAGVLIGNQGENLEALSYLIRRIVERNIEGGDRNVFIVDVNNYQTRKIQELVGGVQTSANRAKLFQQDVELSPMTSYERMIIHSAFSDDPDITTESYGEGKFRRVVLKYKNKGFEAERV